MAIAVEIRDWQKRHLTSLLKVKRANGGIMVPGLKEEIENALTVMDKVDVEHVEAILGVKAL
jgi:hypothetical protein